MCIISAKRFSLGSLVGNPTCCTSYRKLRYGCTLVHCLTNWGVISLDVGNCWVFLLLYKAFINISNDPHPKLPLSYYPVFLSLAVRRTARWFFYDAYSGCRFYISYLVVRHLVGLGFYVAYSGCLLYVRLSACFGARFCYIHAGRRPVVKLCANTDDARRRRCLALRVGRRYISIYQMRNL